MDEDLLTASRAGWLLLRVSTPEGVRLDPPFLRYDPALPRDIRARRIAALLGGERAPAGRELERLT
jgi:hypothetical protein